MEQRQVLGLPSPSFLDSRHRQKWASEKCYPSNGLRRFAIMKHVTPAGMPSEGFNPFFFLIYPCPFLSPSLGRNGALPRGTHISGEPHTASPSAPLTLPCSAPPPSPYLRCSDLPPCSCSAPPPYSERSPAHLNSRRRAPASPPRRAPLPTRP